MTYQLHLLRWKNAPCTIIVIRYEQSQSGAKKGYVSVQYGYERNVPNTHNNGGSGELE